MEFVDRVSAYPGRYTMTDENGNVSYVILERADEPVTVGTPLNAETLNILLQQPTQVADMNTMTELFGVVTADTENSPIGNVGVALNRVFGTYQLQYIFYLSSPGVIASRAKSNGSWGNWSQIKFGWTN